ncbi:uncharacterized protein LOC132722540 [Ruditapes philippinarum]|uniref:uncharacterized protein LOC132722540 n=1 Tax=Ruditapes philippinarum TaxID=129788 RepID=UPI00295B73E9|nr:uncharacterized protein LOC132722540 [Ruditapes philippinarum]XP_060563033.1 uncharacterized protein LOC132722540 [Ruditapes philippinarum]
MDGEFYKLFPYKVPVWADHLQSIPSHFVKLSNLNTPLHRWNFAGLPEGVEIFIKRDDLTGTELSGNKVRSLQILFGEALVEGATHVVTGGGPQSGHCRAVSLICRSLGLKPHIVIEGVEKKADLGSMGNTLLYRMAGSKLYLAPQENYECFKRRVSKMEQFISDTYKEKCYCIPVGGATVKAVFAFISLFEELLQQGLHDRFDDIVVTVATGGTSLGLAVANFITGSKLGVHAVTIGLRKEELYENMNGLLHKLGLDSVKSEDILDIIEGYIGERYGTATDEVLNFITRVSSTTGILLDPYYTGKGALGMIGELENNPSRFKGKRILFIHTGGIFGLFNGEMDRIIDKEEAVTNDITSWPDESVSPVKKGN